MRQVWCCRTGGSCSARVARFPLLRHFLDQKTLTYYPAAAPTDLCENASNASYCKGKTNQNEQGYTLLQDGTVLTIDVWNPSGAQVYHPGTGKWFDIGDTPVPLPDPCGKFEMGPAVTRQDGTVVAFGGHSCSSPDPTATFNPPIGTWTTGPSIPQITGTYYDLADAPAALLPDGNILFAASPGFGLAPTHFFEFTSATTLAANSIFKWRIPSTIHHLKARTNTIFSSYQMVRLL